MTTEQTSYVTRGPGEKIERRYTVLSRAWYGEADLEHMRRRDGTVDDITIGHYSTGGGSTGEFRVSLVQFGRRDEPALKLTLFNDAWHLLKYEADLFRRLSELGDSRSLEDVERVLRECGFVDATPIARCD